MSEAMCPAAPAPHPQTAPAANRPVASQRKSARRALGRVYRFARGCLALLGLHLILFSILFDLGQIVSPSMQPTLQGTKWGNGDWVLSENVSYWFRAPRRWEVVRIRTDDGVTIMKRVAGLPGETIQLIGGQVVINGDAHVPPPSLKFLNYLPYGPYSHNAHAATCGEGYFVLGDDSKDSQDSRFDGPVAPARITSRAWLRVWPLNRIGWITPDGGG